MVLSSDSPLDHKFITDKERDYIAVETKQSKHTSGNQIENSVRVRFLFKTQKKN